MEKNKLFLKHIPCENIALDIPNAIETIRSLPPAKYNSNLLRSLAAGFKSLVYAMDEDLNSQDVYPLFLKWFKLYVQLQHQIDSKDPLRSKFESKIPVCTSYILASLKYQNNIANYHQKIMEMCLLLFQSAQPLTMQKIANLDIELISQLWMPVEFVGDYITQRLCLKLIVAILNHLNAEQRKTKISEAKLGTEIEVLLLKLLADPKNFEEVSRELLNVYNMTLSRNCTVFSIYCTKALFGSFELFKPNNVSKLWIDFNYTSKSVSLLCELNQSEGKQEEFYVKIKIDKIQIENQSDCFVYTIQQATFSTEVSAQLLSSRVAVFTLPKTQLECLKANSDLMDYYNTYSYSESSEVSTPNTIAKYLNDLSEDSPLTPYSEKIYDTPKIKLAKVKLHKCDAVQTDYVKDLTKIQNINFKLGNNATANSKSLVSRVDHLPNYVGPSTKESGYKTCVNTIATEDTTIFKKPSIPILFKKKKKDQSLPMKRKKSQNTSKNPPAFENENIKAITSQKKTEMVPIINIIGQHNSSPMPIYKSGEEQIPSGRRNGPQLTRDEITYTFKSIQVTRNSLQRFSNPAERPIEQQAFHKIQEKLIEENSFLEMSLHEISNDSRLAASLSNEETFIRKSIDSNNFALLQPESSENVLHNHSKQSETTGNPTISIPLQASIIPIQRATKVTNPTQLSQCLEILDDQSSVSQKTCTNLSQEIPNSSDLNRSPIIDGHSSHGENRITSSQTSNEQSQTFSQNSSPSRSLSKQNQILKNINASDTTLQASDCDAQNRTNTLENTASQLPKDTSRRFFKYKNLPYIYPTTAAKRKSRQKRDNTRESLPKTKSVNLVKPLNYVNNPSLNTDEPISESRINLNSKNLVNSKGKAGFLNRKNEVQDLNLTNDSTDQELIQKPTKRRTSKRKTLLKEVQVPNFVPYSIWKIGQKEKNNGESIILSPRPNLQKEITSGIESPRHSKDPFDKVKQSGIENDSISCDQKNVPSRSRRSSFESDAVRTYYFSESENETKSAKDSCPLKSKSPNSLDREIVRREQTDDMIQSPIRVPFELGFSPISKSTESILTPMQMSLSSDCFDGLSSTNESHQILGNNTVNYSSPVRYVSPVYEDLDDEDPLQCDTSQPPKMYNPLTKEYHKDGSPATKHLTNLEDDKQELPNPPDIRPFLESQQPETTSSQGSSVSIYSEAEINERDPYSNQAIIGNNNVVSSVRKRIHSSANEEASLAKIPALTQYTPLRGYDELLPEFFKKLTSEKDRLLINIKTKFNEDIFHNYNKTVDAVTKVIDYYQTAITEEKEKLLSTLENLERHHTILQKNQSELKKLHDQVIICKQTCENKTDKIHEIYKEAEEILISYADVVKKDQWHNFSGSIVNSVNERLRGYLHI